jgi:hypothetical protein
MARGGQWDTGSMAMVSERNHVTMREVLWRGGAQNPHIITAHDTVAGYQYEIFDHCLGNQHSVERIRVVSRQRSRDNGMRWQNR